MTRADTLARLAVCDAEAHAALHALGVERPDSDDEVALACSEADAEHEAAQGTAHAAVVAVLRRRGDALRRAHSYLRAVRRAHDEIERVQS